MSTQQDAKPSSHEPVYHQLSERLRALIRTGDYSEGDRFLTERQVAEQFQVSRPTANKVLAAMAAEGLLEFRKGVGTFVTKPRLNYDLHTLVSFTQKAKDAGKSPATRILQFEEVSASVAGDEIMNRLRCSPADILFFISRLRLADSQPVILENRWVPKRLCPRLTRRELHGSLYSLWREKYHWRIAEADQTIRAVNLVGLEAKLLEVPSGLACFLVSAVGFSGDDPVWWERTLYRGDAYEFHHSWAAGGRLIRM
jgi:GntR family transcriptional regulator